MERMENATLQMRHSRLTRARPDLMMRYLPARTAAGVAVVFRPRIGYVKGVHSLRGWNAEL